MGNLGKTKIKAKRKSEKRRKFAKMSKMHVLVGGGTGFIGRHLIKQLNTTGHKVTIVSRGAVPGHAHVTWDDVASGTMPEDITAIVNLAGAQILSIKARIQPEQFKRE